MTKNGNANKDKFTPAENLPTSASSSLKSGDFECYGSEHFVSREHNRHLIADVAKAFFRWPVFASGSIGFAEILWQIVSHLAVIHH